MNSQEIRQAFFDFFESKQHKIVPSAPMVLKGDPTLMFTNAGMNQFKEIFLGNADSDIKRVADSQKCLRVSGKHNDLEEVGHDTYHHTMFEMLGNWSFGDYFKKEAIDYAWEFLVDVMKINPENLYATVFEGSKEDQLEADEEAKSFWKKHLPEDRIIYGSKKDNFWEMGETGPCGPCSEVHIDLREDSEKQQLAGKELVNKDHPQVIEIWNLVFIQFNRKKDNSLVNLPDKHVDTGMGFERLCRVVQGKKSNYDIDLFVPIITEIEKLTGHKYGEKTETDVAMRVITDHLRTISFSIADGQLPSNEKAGYVIRRILRRAIRYAFTFLDQKTAFIYNLLPALIDVMGNAYPELIRQKEIISKVILKEEETFLNTLENGIKLLDKVIEDTKKDGYQIVSGKVAFELSDTFGFPLDLTQLILHENNLIVNKKEYNEELEKQKNRSKNAAKLDTHDWVVILEDDVEEFIGYDQTETNLKITRYRKVTKKGKDLYHLVFNYTPFYAESGGQVGDTGYIENDENKLEIFDTQKEHGLIIHYAKELPKNITATFHAVVNKKRRLLIAANHSATHLLHNALRKVVGSHVEQKGSLVNDKKLRFDFSHFQKLTDQEIAQIETIVNNKIRQNISLVEKRAIPMTEAQKMGAIALFGEKYGDLVRVIKFDDAVELCGGIHAEATGNIGLVKIISESSVSTGTRRIEAITGVESEKYINSQLEILKKIKQFFKASKNLAGSVEKLLADNKDFAKQIENLNKLKLSVLKNELKNKTQIISGINVIAAKIEIDSANLMKQLATELKGEINDLFLCLGADIQGKAMLSIDISKNLISDKNLNANNIIRLVSKEIQGGGGGQAFSASAGGKNPDGLEKAINLAISQL